VTTEQVTLTSLLGDEDRPEPIRHPAAAPRDTRPGGSAPTNWLQRYVLWRRAKPDASGQIVEYSRRRALQIRERGFARYDIGAVLSIARWDSDLALGPTHAGFKINQNFASYIGRELSGERETCDALRRIGVAPIGDERLAGMFRFKARKR